MKVLYSCGVCKLELGSELELLHTMHGVLEEKQPRKPLYYLASPYAHSDFKVRESRYRSAVWAMARLQAMGRDTFSPIAHTHVGISQYSILDKWGHEDWMKFDLNILSRCDGLVVLMLEGWRESKGVGIEIEWAKAHGMPVEYMLMGLGSSEGAGMGAGGLGRVELMGEEIASRMPAFGADMGLGAITTPGEGSD